MPEVEFVEHAPFVQEPLSPEVLRHRQTPHGQSSDALSLSRETAIQAAEMAGVVPFSVWNFNPVPISVISQGKTITVLPVQDKLGIKRSLTWGNVERHANTMVLRNLDGFQRPISVSPTADPQAPDVQREWRVIQPIENARKFEYEYNMRTPLMGGVLVFQGDGKAVGPTKSNDQIIHIPQATRARNRSLLYHTNKVPISLIEKLDEVFHLQKQYCFMRLAEAQAFADDPEPEIRKSVYNGPAGYAAWGQFSIDMGWKERGELPWMMMRDATQTCIRCGKGKTSGVAMFCQCGYPYDPFGAFMAGMPVERDILSTLPAEQLELVKAEIKRRARLFEDLDEPTQRKQRN